MKKENNNLSHEDELLLKIIAHDEKNHIDDIEDFEKYYVEEEAKLETTKDMVRKIATKNPKYNIRILVPAIILALLLFVGAGYQLWNVLTKDHHSYTEIIKLYEYPELEEHFAYLPSQIPDDYNIAYLNINGNYREIVFQNTASDINKIMFSESNSIYSYGIDTEDIAYQNVSIGEFWGFYLHKDGLQTLIWEQNGRFYRLLVVDESFSRDELIKMVTWKNDT